MRSALAAIALVMVLPTPAWAQAKPDPFKVEENPPEHKDFLRRTYSIPADKRAAAGPGIRGAVLEVLGKPWWQILSYCAGVYNFRWEQAKTKGDAVGQTAADNAGRFFQVMALRRIEEDRGISNADARNIIGQELSYYTMAAADGGEDYRPFALDESRCRDVRVGYIVTFRPGPVGGYETP